MQAEQQYIARAKAGDTAAFNHLLSHYTDLAYSLAFKILRNKEDAEEVVQDSFVKVFKYLKNFREDAKFSTWLYKIVYNTAITKCHQNNKNRSTELNEIIEKKIDTSDVNASMACLKKEEQKKFINLALNKLSTEDRSLLSLFYITENSVEEIEAITGYSKSNVKTRLHRARKKMHDQLVLILGKENPRNLL